METFHDGIEVPGQYSAPPPPMLALRCALLSYLYFLFSNYINMLFHHGLMAHSSNLLFIYSDVVGFSH